MATSGTVAKTVIDTSTLLEHAFRRVKVAPSAQTPETIEIAKNCLYMLMLNLSNRGLNLWCVDKIYFGLNNGQATYPLPAGTLDVVSAAYSAPTLAAGTFAAVTNGGEANLSSAEAGIRIGVKLSGAFSGVLTTDGTAQRTADYVANQYYWFDIPVSVSKTNYQVTGTNLVSDVQVVTKSYDLPMTQWNRDTYVAINNKTQPGHPSTNYFFEKKLDPQLTLWPVPDSDTGHLLLFVHRQAQDIGTLVQQIEIPQRWLDGVIWLLADRLGYELPNVDPAVAQRVEQKAQMQTFEAELSETDGAPIFLQPNIGVYSR